MTLSNAQIERYAVTAISIAANQPRSYLIPDIPVGDKGVSFDGTISVFYDGTEKKESLIGIVPVQVKGNLVSDFHTGIRSFSLEMAHYRNYLNRDGVLLLVVEVKISGETNIFYKSLLGMELSQILKHYGHQKSKTVELRPLDETNLYTICRKFLHEQTFQPKMLVEKAPFSFNDFQSYTFSSLTFDPAHPKTNSIFEHDFTIYGVVNQARFPLQAGRISSMAISDVTRFSVNGQTFDLVVRKTIEEHITTLVIEQIFTIKIDLSKNRFNFRFMGFHSLFAQIKAIPFILELLSGHLVEFSDCTFALNQDALEIKDELKEIYDHQENLHAISRIFQHLGIPEDTVFQETDDNDFYRTLDALTYTINQNELNGIIFDSPDNLTMINVELGDKTVGVFYNPKGDTLLINGYSDEMLEIECFIDSENGKFKHSIFNIFSEEVLAKSVNFNAVTIMKSFDQFDPFLNETIFNWTNTFCLKCICAYDQSGNPQLLEIVSYVYDKYILPVNTVGDLDPMTRVVLINRLQVQKRQCSELTERELEKLIHLKREAVIQEDHGMLFCINILLESKVEAQLEFNQLRREEQEYFEELPIYKLFLDL